MRFNKHWNLEGKHSFLSPSQHHWVNYTDEKLVTRYLNHSAADRGTKLHSLAKDCIELGIELPDNGSTLSMYVNDAIFFKMIPEQPLYYSRNCFGTADAISFEDGLLRIHDLKTGSSPASMMQLEIYASIFCLEYDINPGDIGIELRLYQSDAVTVEEPRLDTLAFVIDRIVYFDALIEDVRNDM